MLKHKLIVILGFGLVGVACLLHAAPTLAANTQTSGSNLVVEKLTPQVRVLPLSQKDYKIPLDKIKPFLNGEYVIEKEQMDKLPYIIASPLENFSTSAGDIFYARRVRLDNHHDYMVARPGQEFKDPVTEEVLGYEAIDIGDATVQSPGDPATLLMLRSTKEAREGDRLIKKRRILSTDFKPKPAEHTVNSVILAVQGNAGRIGTNDVVTILGGAEDGMVAGDLLAIYRPGQTVKDKLATNPKEEVKLPNLRMGELMVFQTFSRLSLAIVLDVNDPVALQDIVTNIPGTYEGKPGMAAKKVSTRDL